MSPRSLFAAAFLALTALLSAACGDAPVVPTFEFTLPGEDEFVAGQARFEVVAAPAGTVTEVVFSVAGVEVARVSEEPFEVVLDTTVYSDGPLTLVAEAEAAAAGADATPDLPLTASVSVKVDNEPPVIELLPPTAAFVEDGEELSVQLHVTDGNGVVKVGAHAIGPGTDVAREVYDPSEIIEVTFPLAEVRPGAVTAWEQVRVLASAVDAFGRQTWIDETIDIGTRQLWAANVAGLMVRPPVVADDGTVWVGATKVTPDEGRIVRLDPANGAELCDAVLGIETVYSGAQAGDLLVFGTSRAVRAFRRDDCGLAWTVGDPVGAPRSYWGTPAYDAGSGRVFAADADGRIVSIDAVTGVGTLFADTGEEIQSSPVVAVTGEVFVATVSGRLYGYDAAGAALAWSPYSAAGSVFGDPVIHLGAVYFGSMDTFLYALDPSNGALLPGFGVAPDGFAIRSTPALAPDRTALIATIGGFLHAVDSGGVPLWQFDTGPISRGGAVVYEDGDVWQAIIGSTNGSVYGVDSSGQQVWRAPTGGQIQTYGALGGTSFYTPSDDFRVYAFDVGPPVAPSP